MSDEVISKYLLDVRCDSRHDDVRLQAAVDLRSYLERLNRELSQEAFTRLLQDVNRRIFDLVNSSDVNAQLGGIWVIVQLLQANYEENETKIIRFANYLRMIFQQSGMTDYDQRLLREASHALGLLASVGGPLATDIVEFEVKRALEWLEGDRSEQRRYCAVCVLKELAEHTPTLFNIHVGHFLDHIWVTLRDQKLVIREASVEALRSCLTLIAKRSMKLRQTRYAIIYQECLASVRSGVNEAIHAGLLTIGELLRNSGDFLSIKYRECGEMVLRYRDHKEKYIRETVLTLIPQLAAFSPSIFLRLYFKDCLHHLLNTLRAGQHREIAFVALGEFCLAMREAILPELETIIGLVREGLTARSKKAFCVEALSCIAMVCRAVGAHPRLQAQMNEVIEQMFSAGLSSTLVAALTIVSQALPTFLPSIQERLLTGLTVILASGSISSSKDKDASTRRSLSLSSFSFPFPSTFSFPFPLFSTTQSELKATDPASTDLLHLALQTLGSFDFHTHNLLPFVRDVVLGYLDDERPRIRRTAAMTCAQILLKAEIGGSAAQSVDTDVHTTSSNSIIMSTTTAFSSLTVLDDRREEEHTMSISEQHDRLLRTIRDRDLSVSNGRDRDREALKEKKIVQKMVAGIEAKKPTGGSGGHAQSPGMPRVSSHPALSTSPMMRAQTASPAAVPAPVSPPAHSRQAATPSHQATATAPSPPPGPLSALASSLSSPIVPADHSHSVAHAYNYQLIVDIMERLLTVGISDPDPNIRKTVIDALHADIRFDRWLCHDDNVHSLFVMLNDEVFAIRETAMRVIGRLSQLTPASVMPLLRKTLIQLLTELQYTGDQRQKEESAILLGHLIASAQYILRPYVLPVLKVLIIRLKDVDHAVASPAVISCVLATLGQLTMIGGQQVIPYLDQLLPLIIPIIQDRSSLVNKEVALRCLSALIESTGYVIAPYDHYPSLLPTLLSVLKAGVAWNVRREVIKLIGIMGALDPYRYKRNMMKIGIYEGDASSTATSTSRKIEDDMKSTTMTTANVSSSTAAVNAGSTATNVTTAKMIGIAAIAAQKKIIANVGGGLGTNVHDQPQQHAHANTAVKAMISVKDGHHRHSSSTGTHTTTLVIHHPSEDYYPTVAIQSLINILCESTLSAHHTKVIQALQYIIKNMSSTKLMTFLPLILPPFITVLKHINAIQGEESIRDSLFIQLTLIISIVRHHIRSYLPDLIELILLYWCDLQIIHDHLFVFIEKICFVMKEEWKIYLPQLLPAMLSLLHSDRSIGRNVTYKLLHAFEVFGNTLTDYLHLIIPAILRLAEQPDSSLLLRVNAMKTIGWLAKTMNISDYAGRILHPLARILDTPSGSDKVASTPRGGGMGMSGIGKGDANNPNTSSYLSSAAREEVFNTLCWLVYQLGTGYVIFIPMINKILQRQNIHHDKYEALLAKILTHQPLTSADMISMIKSNQMTRIGTTSLGGGSSGAGSDYDKEESALNTSGGAGVGKQTAADGTTAIGGVVDDFETHVNASGLTDSTINPTNANATAGTSLDSSTNISMKKLTVSQSNLKKAWEVSQRSTGDDWVEWFRGLSLELLKESPSPCLRACAILAQKYHALARELFPVAFVSCWSELYDEYQDDLVRCLEIALNSHNIPSELIQVLLMLAEFMERDGQRLPIDIVKLGMLAQHVHAYAKALHYKEMEFWMAPHQSIEGLISIHNQLQQPEAAEGVLDYARIHLNTVVLKESWYEKLQRWEEALEAYELKSLTSGVDEHDSNTSSSSISPGSSEGTTTTMGSTSPLAIGSSSPTAAVSPSSASSSSAEQKAALDACMGRMRCLKQLGEWERLHLLAADTYAHTNDEQIQREIAPLAATAAWMLKQWDQMTFYVSIMEEGRIETEFLRAVLAVHHQAYNEAQACIDRTRELLDSELAALVSESYHRAYRVIVQIQQMAELEEIMMYQQTKDVKQREALLSMWRTRLHGCQENVEVWSAIIAVRAMVMTPNEDIETYLKYSTLCRKNHRLSTSLKVFHALLPAEVIEHDDTNSTDMIMMTPTTITTSTIGSMSPYGMSPTASPSAAFSLHHPKVMFAYLKHLWSAGLHETAFSMMLQFASVLNTMKGRKDDDPASQASRMQHYDREVQGRTLSFLPQPISTASLITTTTTSTSTSTNDIPSSFLLRPSSPSSSFHHILTQSELNHLRSRIYLKLGAWQLSLDNDHLTEYNIHNILASYHSATLYDPYHYRVWHNWAVMNFRVITHYKTLKQAWMEKMRAAAEERTKREGSATATTPTSTTVVSRGKNASLHHHRQHSHGLLDGTVSDDHLDTDGAMDEDDDDDDVFDSNAHKQRTQRRIEELDRKISAHVVPAIKGFFKSIALAGDQSLQDILRLLTLWFNHGMHTEVEQALNEGFSQISMDTWLPVIPQIIARIDTSSLSIRRMIQTLLCQLGKSHPQALVYPLAVVLKSQNVNRENSAALILNDMRQHSLVLVDQALMVSKELIRVAILWHEMWHEALEEASRLWFGQKNVELMMATLAPLHTLINAGPSTLREMIFLQCYGRDLAEAQEWCQRYQHTGYESDLNAAWDLYCTVFRKINKQLSATNELELQYVSPRLLNARHLELAMPGTYLADRDSHDKRAVSITSFVRKLKVIESKQRPRKLSILGSDGMEYIFLLKGHEDLRQDKRVMQLFGLINTFLSNNNMTNKKDLKIQGYSVIPLSPDSGLIQWLHSCDTFHALIKDYRDYTKVLLNIEHRLMLTMAPDYPLLTLIQKVEVFEYALSRTSGQDLTKVLYLHSPTSEAWLDRRTHYTYSLAVMSMVGYILGLGDRHPCNLMLDQSSGKVIHVDFGDCFEVAQTREKFPERIPFRLTRMLVLAMEVSGIEGSYRHVCESVMQVLRENKESVMAVLEAFVYDPLLGWRLFNTTNNNTNNNTTTNNTTTSATNNTNNSTAPVAGSTKQVNVSNAQTTQGVIQHPAAEKVGDGSEVTLNHKHTTSKRPYRPAKTDGIAPVVALDEDENKEGDRDKAEVSFVVGLSPSARPIMENGATSAATALHESDHLPDPSASRPYPRPVLASLFSNTAAPQAPEENEVLNAKALSVIARVEGKLVGKDFGVVEGKDVLDVREQVDRLIKEATSHVNLCQCYVGWCPFW